MTVHLIRHHPRTRRLRKVLAALPNMAVVRLAAKNVLSEKAPKYLMSMSFVLANFVQDLIHSCMKSPGSSSFQGSLEDGSCDHDIVYNLGPPASPWPKSSSSDCPLMIPIPSIMRAFQVTHQRTLPLARTHPLL